MTLPDTPPETTLPAVDSVVAVSTNGGLLVYDQEEPAAWLRTDSPVALDERC